VTYYDKRQSNISILIIAYCVWTKN